MLQQLRDSGALGRVRGVVLGTLEGCRVPPGADYTLADVIDDALEPLGVPVAWGLPSGHTSGGSVTLPFGVRARLEVESGAARLEVLERAVA